MKKMTKKFLPALLALCMVLTLLPGVARAEGNATISITKNTYTVGEQVTQIEITATEGTFIKAEDATNFEITSNFGLTLQGAQAEDGGSSATLTVSGTLTKDGTITVTAKKEAFTNTADADATAEITVNKPTAAVSMTKEGDGTLKQGASADGVQIKLTASGTSVSFKGDIATNDGYKSNFLFDPSDLTVSSIAGSNTEIILTITGTPQSKGGETLGLTIDKDVFEYEPIEPSITASGTITIEAADPPKSSEAAILKVSPADSQFTEKNSGINAVDFASIDTGGTEISIPYNAEGVDLASAVKLQVTATASSVKYTTTKPGAEDFSGATENKDALSSEFTLTLTDAKVEESKDVNLYIKVTAEDELTSQFYKIVFKMEAAPEPSTPTISSVNPESFTYKKDVGTLSVNITDGKFVDSLTETDKFTLTGGLTVSTVERKTETQVDLTVAGAPQSTSEITLTIDQTAFKNASMGATKVITVNPAKVTSVTLEGSASIEVTSDDNLFAEQDVITNKLSSLKVKLTGDDITGEVYAESVSWKCNSTYDPTKTDGGQTFTGEVTLPAGYAWGSDAQNVTVTVTLTVAQTEKTDPAPVTPPSPSTPSTPSTPAVSEPATDSESGETTVDVNTNSTTSGTTANATVSASNMDAAVDSAVKEAEKQNTAPVVEINVKTSSRADSLNVSLPAKSLETLAKAEDATLVVTSDIAEVALDSAALAALAEQATGSTVVLEVAPVKAEALTKDQAEAVGEAAVVDLSMVSNGVAIHDYKNGRITATLPYELAEGQSAEDVVVYYLDDDGLLTACDTSFDAKAGKVTFVTVHLSKYVIGDAALGACPAELFKDLDTGRWYHKAVDYVLSHKVMNGSGDTFGPDNSLSRAELAQVLYNLDGNKASDFQMTYTDVPEGKWYTEAVRWASGAEIVFGSNGLYRPNDAITREDLALMLYRYECKQGGGFTGEWAFHLDFPDADKIGSWAYEAVCWCAMNGILNGKGTGLLDPKGPATRAETAQMLMTYLKLKADK